MRPILITGCSGGGKSTLLAELSRRGHHTVEEPGRRIVRAAQAGRGGALPWEDLDAFARQALDLAHRDFQAARAAAGSGEPVFFDRGMVDAALALPGADAGRVLASLPRYERQVFLAPPWEAIFAADRERRAGFAAATAEYHRIEAALPWLGYRAMTLPRADVAARADHVLATLGKA